MLQVAKGSFLHRSKSGNGGKWRISMRCSYCGRENPDNARFCGRCGRQTDINFPGRNTDRNSYPGSVNDRRNAFSDSIPSKGSVKKNGGPQKKKHRAAFAVVTVAIAVAVIFFLLPLSGLSLPDSENLYAHDTADITTVLAGGDISGAITTDGILYMWGCGDSMDMDGLEQRLLKQMKWAC